MLVDAGDRVPADGRVIVAATLQIEEGALTGESVAVEKSIDAITAPDVPLADRSDMAFMNTNVTRGHGEILVTTTGMGSEVGHIASILAGQKVEKSPLTKQVDRLTIFIIIMAGHRLRLDHRDRAWPRARTPRSCSTSASPWRSAPSRTPCRRS